MTTCIRMFELTDDALTQMNRILVGHRQDNDVEPFV